MANIVVSIADANTIKVDFGDYYPDYHDVEVAYYNRNIIQRIELMDDRVQVHIANGSRDWELAYTNTTGAFTVDEVDGDSTITDNDDLAAKIAALIIA